YAPDINAPEKLNKSVLFSTTGSLSSFDVDVKGKYIAYNREIEHDNFETVIQTISDGKTIYRGRFHKTIFFIDAVGFYDAKQSSWYIASFPDFNIINT